MTPGQRTDSSLFFELRKHLERKGDIKIGHHFIGIQMETRDRYLIRTNVARNNAIRRVSPIGSRRSRFRSKDCCRFFR